MQEAKTKILAVRRWVKWGGLLAIAAVAGCSEKAPDRRETRPLVRVGAARQGVTFVDALRVQGAVRAKDAAGVSARIPGTIDAVFVEEGARVKKGDALFQVDRQNLENAVRAAKDDLAMAKAKLATRNMGIDIVPNVVVPYVSVIVVYPGASPEEIETSVARPIEDAAVQVDGLKHMTTTCANNFCQVMLEFNLNVDQNVAADDIRASSR